MRHGRGRIAVEVLEADARGALRRQRNVVVTFLRVTHQQTLTFFKVFKRPDEIGSGKLAGAVEKLLSSNARTSLLPKEGQHVFLNLRKSSSIHFPPGVVD